MRFRGRVFASIVSGLGLLSTTGCSSSKSSTSTPEPTSNGNRGPGGDHVHEEPTGGDCPGLVSTEARSGTGPSIATGEDMDLEALAALFPEVLAGATRGAVRINPRGTAGMASPNVGLHYADGEDTLYVNMVDLQHVCRCTSGMGQRLRDRALRPDGTTRSTDYEGAPAVITDDDGGGEVSVWVQDRCVVSFSARLSVARQAAREAPWSEIKRLCERAAP